METSLMLQTTPPDLDQGNEPRLSSYSNSAPQSSSQALSLSNAAGSCPKNVSPRPISNHQNSTEDVLARHELPPSACSQAVLSSACRRIGMSGSGTKDVLISRLAQKGVISHSRIVELKKNFDECGADISERNGRSRAPNWTKEESARLCHVIADSRNTIILARYQRISTRAELDKPRHDPFAEEFRLLLNDPDFKPEPSEAYDGVTLDVLPRIDPSVRKHFRDGQTLKQKWTKLRSTFSIACKNYQASGQGDADAFPSFTQGDDVLCYMHCVFHDHTSLDLVLRIMPPASQIESGISDQNAVTKYEKATGRSGGKRRRDETTDALAAAITSLASSKENDRPIVIQESGSNATAVDSQMVEVDRSMKIAGTVSSLMDLEAKILSTIKGLQNDGEYSKRCLDRY